MLGGKRKINQRSPINIPTHALALPVQDWLRSLVGHPNERNPPVNKALPMRKPRLSKGLLTVERKE